MKKLLIFIIPILILDLFITSVQITINIKSNYKKYYEKNSIKEEYGISNEDSVKAIYKLIDYMENRSDTIQLKVFSNNEEVLMYNNEEIEHMKDVKTIYSRFRIFRNITLLMCIPLLIIILKKRSLRILTKTFLKISLILSILISIITIYIINNFHSSWIFLHNILFNNDLWIMSYDSSRMIQICQPLLFKELVFKVFILFFVIYIVIILSSIIYLKISKSKVDNCE